MIRFSLPILDLLALCEYRVVEGEGMKPALAHRNLYHSVLLLSLMAGSGLAHAQSGGATILLQPVPPKTVPASNYPAGTTIVGQDIFLGSVPARVWLDVHVTGWSPEMMRVVQIGISATDAEEDGGGYAGEDATCLNQPPVGAGNLAPALQSCNVHSDCRSTLSGLSGPCTEGEPSRCVDWDGTTSPGNYFPAGRFCEPAFIQSCDPEWIGTGIEDVKGIDISNGNFRIGVAIEPTDPPQVVPDFHPSYLGTIVLDVPADGQGVYTIYFDEAQTFMQNHDVPGNNNIPLTLFPARITIATEPCGRCCSGYVANQIQCVDHVAAEDCVNANDQIFTLDEPCPVGGGTDCAECISANNCDDGIACTTNQCSGSHECFYTPNHALCDDGLFCNGQEICEATSGCGDGQDPCEPFQCDEDVDACRDGIPTVSNWGLGILVLALLIGAKLRYRHEASPV